MPSMFGGSSSARDYAPHMYLLGPDGNGDNDKDYAFVGNTVRSVRDKDVEYKVGHGVMGLVANKFEPLQPDRPYPSRQSYIEVEELPQSVIRNVLDKALAPNADLPLVRALAKNLEPPVDLSNVELPEKPDIANLFDRNPAVQETARAIQSHFEESIVVLRKQLGFEV